MCSRAWVRVNKRAAVIAFHCWLFPRLSSIFLAPPTRTPYRHLSFAIPSINPETHTTTTPSSEQVAPLFYPEVLALTKDLGKYGDYFLGYDNVTGAITQNSTTFCSQMHVEPNTPETENCLAYVTT